MGNLTATVAKALTVKETRRSPVLFLAQAMVLLYNRDMKERRATLLFAALAELADMARPSPAAISLQTCGLLHDSDNALHAGAS